MAIVNMFIKYSFFILLLFAIQSLVVVKAQEIEPVHYAYANYLGSGIYRTTGQHASLISMPFSYEIGQKGKTTYGLRLPVSVGFFDFGLADLPDLEFPDEVGTVTFTPGLAFNYQYNQDWQIQSYIDLGYGRNLTTDKGVSVFSSGVSALFEFDIKNYDSIWANRIYYASYDGNGYEAQDSYAALQIGIDSGLPLQYQVFGYQFQPRVFATAFWYFSEVDFLTARTQSFDEERNVTLTNSLEFGFTLKFAKTIGYSWAGIERLGLSYRYSKNFSAFRLLFSFPI
ncbi:hypothetical protein [Colwellia psychrerythraea]|uniref:Uncharacterized protein n=1 Tax=Colwellia psychrerythraea TaxID=28229 RepID=A0A099KAE6_COLPS|nr:hypothetical protein [Colwellia psychrerythraea]KGJ86568.1 hypothetical protein GAB14E_0841 [Colwellia psychrerythraea]